MLTYQIQTIVGLFLCCLRYESRLKGMSIITYLISWKITTFVTIFSLDLDHSTRATLLCLHCVTCGYLLLITEVSDWCKQNRMCLHPEKTKCMVITTRQKHQRSPLCLKLEVNFETVTQVKEHRILGLTIDDELKWQSHVGNVCKTVSKKVFLMSQLKLSQLPNP